MNNIIDFTIFTPCYNSASTIERTFNSILNLQYDLNKIQWLVVDNKSEDETLNIVENIKSKYLDLNIKIIAVDKNKGINNSFNLGAIHSEGTYWINLDSDDEIKENALNEFWATFKRYENNSNIARVIARCETQYGKSVGISNVPNESVITLENLINRDKISGEMFSAYKTSVIKEFLFPDNFESFINISWKWMMMSSKYDAIYIDRVLRVYYVIEGTWTTHMKKTLYVQGNVYYYQTLLDTMGNKLISINQRVYAEYVFRYLLNAKFIDSLSSLTILNRYVVNNINKLNIIDILKCSILIITPRILILKIKNYKVVI
ncbi:glycosyltransferase family 2 protein [Aliarcobacter cryaerophilus]|uniref:glycosyltransferase family 2 protein n=1 Tax=Aliarcobacter cryaerophilus TaxID=28198 RepID=UPI0021B56942|nr:glycosyltransferase family 2 protein [Aliarcobacter cryaerophilus]MCT7492515.1 glycosyltransferase family 2 protein [Aliarcobacter cryaerophilus]